MVQFTTYVEARNTSADHNLHRGAQQQITTSKEARSNWNQHRAAYKIPLTGAPQLVAVGGWEKRAIAKMAIRMFVLVMCVVK